jgi:hypothetical protein
MPAGFPEGYSYNKPFEFQKKEGEYLEVTKVSNCKMETPFKEMCFVSADYALFSPSSFIP